MGLSRQGAGLLSRVLQLVGERNSSPIRKSWHCFNFQKDKSLHHNPIPLLQLLLWLSSNLNVSWLQPSEFICSSIMLLHIHYSLVIISTTFPRIKAGSPDFFRNAAASEANTLPVLPVSTWKEKQEADSKTQNQNCITFHVSSLIHELESESFC